MASSSISVNQPVITAEAKKYVMEAMESGWVSSAGPFLERFEAAFAKALGTKHAVTTTNGTTALHLALASLDIGPGDEVVVPAFTMMSSICAILYTGAKPVFVDVDPDIFTMDAAGVQKKITKDTKAIMPVHIYGHSADMDPILKLAAEHRIAVVEDAAEVHGATYKEKPCGSMGALGCFSFYGNKIVTTGEGGMVVTNDDELAEACRSLKDLAHSKQKRFWHERLGYNYRMTNLQAACGLGQLEHLEEFVAKKQHMAERYEKHLSDIQGLRLPITKPWAKNVYWMYAVLVEDSFPLRRDELRKKLKEKGVDTRDFFYSAPAQPLVKDFVDPSETFPVTEDIAERGLYLPSGLAITDAQIDSVCNAIRSIAATS